MTRRVMHDLGCVCGRHFRRALYHSLTIADQPGLRYGVLAGVVNVVQCPSCERIARLNLPFLYQDSARGRLIYVYPVDTSGDGDGAEDGDSSELADEGVGVEMHLLGEGDGEIPGLEGLPRPTVMFGIEQLSGLIAGELTPGEEPGMVAFDARPGIRAERIARVMAERLVQQVGGYIYSWREGGRLHMEVLGPSSSLERLTNRPGDG